MTALVLAVGPAAAASAQGPNVITPNVAPAAPFAPRPGYGVPMAARPNVPAPAAPAPAPAAAPTTMVGAAPPAQEAFVKAVDEARQSYAGALNDMVRGVARPRRAEALCRAVPKARLENWVGKLAMLGSSPGGRGMLAIEVSPKLTFATNRSDAADERDKTMIDVRSPLFGAAAVLAVGDRVQFSGALLPGGEDCFKEVGKDIAATMTQPEFILRLDAIKKVSPPAANAVLSGQVAAMSIAQSSDYVRDAVDVIAGAVACGMENRRVFATIIKVMIRASAGQSVEQRDNLITMIFSPPSQQAQTKDDCEAKVQLFDRLEEDAS
jgi:hypothetical protein